MTIPLLMGSHSESSSSTIILIPIIPIWLPFTIITSNTIITIIIIVVFLLLCTDYLCSLLACVYDGPQSVHDFTPANNKSSHCQQMGGFHK